MDQLIAYNRNGKLILLYPAPSASIETVMQRDVPSDATEVEILTKDKVPSTNYFRKAWFKQNGKIEVDMDMAREHHMQTIRAMRDLELEKLDAQAIRALGSNDTETLAKIESKKNILRNIPQTFKIAHAQTPEQLMILWPNDLPKVK
jgi:hypothetical protein